MGKLVKLSSLALLFILPCLSSNAEIIQGTVLSIHDGDTLKIKADRYGKPKNVRLRGVDTPEIDFRGETQGPIALQARDFLRSLIPIGAIIQVELGDSSKNYNRLLGKVFYEGKDIGLLMISEGFAAPYFIYPFKKRTLTDYQKAARTALTNRKGFIYLETEMPYEFRMNVQGYQGTNYVGDSQSKILYQPVDVFKVHYSNRVFFKYLEDAQMMGYELEE